MIDVPKADKIGNEFEVVKGGFIISAHTEKGAKQLFLPRELNSNIEDEFYHGEIVGDYHG